MKKQIGVIGIFLMLLVVGLSGCTETEAKDSDGDGYNNDVDAFPELETEWFDTDEDGVGDNADAFDDDSTQWADRDGDGYGDNPIGFNPDIFPDDVDEWRDSDSDGVGDNSDIYDLGNGGIKITIHEFTGDGSLDEDDDGGIIDPMAKLFFDERKKSGDYETIFSGTSEYYFNEVSVTDLYGVTIDIDEDISDISRWYLRMTIYDYDSLLKRDIIDVNSQEIETGVHILINPNSVNFETIYRTTDNGSLDTGEECDNMNGYIDWSYELIGI